MAYRKKTLIFVAFSLCSLRSSAMDLWDMGVAALHKVVVPRKASEQNPSQKEQKALAEHVEPEVLDESESSSSDETSKSEKRMKKFRAQQRSNVTLIEKDSPIKFFENDFMLPPSAAKVIQRVAEAFLQGQQFKGELLTDYYEFETLLTEWSQCVRPQIVLHAQGQSGLSKDLKKDVLENKKDDRVKPFDAGRITDMSVKLDQENAKANQGFKLIKRVVKEESRVAAEETVYIPLKDACGTCVAINPYSGDIYIGCKNGKIYVFDPHSHEQRMEFKGHLVAIDALAVIDDGKGIVSRDVNGTVYIWSTSDDRPRLALEDVKHSKTYYLNSALIRSHFGGGSYMRPVVGVSDGLYKIPRGYLHGKQPGHHIEHIAFFYLLKRLEVGAADKAKIAHTLFNSYVLNTFEPTVTETIKRYIVDTMQKSSEKPIEEDAMQPVKKGN